MEHGYVYIKPDVLFILFLKMSDLRQIVGNQSVSQQKIPQAGSLVISFGGVLQRVIQDIGHMESWNVGMYTLIEVEGGMSMKLFKGWNVVFSIG